MQKETISAQEMLQRAGEFTIIDLRDSYAYEFGAVDGAVNLTEEAVLQEPFAEKSVLLYCKNGTKSAEVAQKLREKGIDACSLEGGYSAWIQEKLNVPSRAKEIEKSIQKKFHRCIWSKFAKAIIDYKLINPGDKIAVCISGGKDSMLMAKLFQELKRHNKVPFELVFMVMDPGYSPANRIIIEKNAALMDIPIEIFETNIFSSVLHVENNPCYLCARMRRGHLYNEAKKRGCNKIALGHHYDDVIETILMGMIYGGQVQTMMPKLHSDNFEGMQLIRPMYYIREADVKHWRDYNDLHFLQCACKFTEQSAVNEADSKRLEIKHLIAKLAQGNQQIESNIFRSVENVNLKTILSYKKGKEVHHFLDDYED